MQIDIRNTLIFQNTLKRLQNLQSRTEKRVDYILRELQTKQENINKELSFTNNLLKIARINETQKGTILAKKTAELASAKKKEAIAIGTGNSAIIAVATAYVAKKVHEVAVANKKYQKARRNRIKMEKKVELIQKAKRQLDTLFEQIKIQLNSGQRTISTLTQVATSRLIKVDLHQKEYLLSEKIKINSDKHQIKYSNIPLSGGSWSGELGNSKWKPDRKLVPKQPYGNKRSWAEILDKYNIDGIEFKNGEPDFTTVAEATVVIEEFSIQRDDNFRQADEVLAKKWSKRHKYGKYNWCAEDIKKYRKKQKLSWHERSDMQTLDLVPQEIHANVPHSGGISKKKRAIAKENNSER